MNRDNDAAAGCGLFVLAIVITFPLAFYEGWVASLLWQWFVVPTFNAPELAVIPAAGIAMLIAMVGPQGGRIADNSADIDLFERFSVPLMYSVMGPTAALFFGWVLHLVAQ